MTKGGRMQWIERIQVLPGGRFLGVTEQQESVETRPRIGRIRHDGWVTRSKEYRFIVTALTERGRAILEEEVPARIRRFGPYRGPGPWRCSGRVDPG